MVKRISASRIRRQIGMFICPVAITLLAFFAFADFSLAQAGDASQTDDGRVAFEEKVIPTAFYPVKVSIHRGLVYRWQYGGGVAPLGDGYLLATRQGLLYFFKWTEADELRIEQLAHRVPLNFEDFDAQADEKANRLWFRVADVATRENADNVRIIASHHVWRTNEKCSVARISMLEVTRAEFLAGSSNAEWQSVYETTPCLPIAEGNRGFPFAGNHVGGRLLFLGDDELLVAFGDHAFDGWSNEPALPQEPDNTYGKTVLIDLASGSSEIFTTGHRVPSGLIADAHTGDIWLTEHGPQGGDELNLLERGANYGWPLATYGTANGLDYWPPGRQQGEHDGFRRPMYSWIPSIGVSSLLVLDKESQFPVWQGDLLISSLRDQSILRVRLREKRVAYGERIAMHTRIRDLLQGHDGRIVIWSDEGELISLQHNDIAKSGE